jgi:hypothetical protein
MLLCLHFPGRLEFAFDRMPDCGSSRDLPCQVFRGGAQRTERADQQVERNRRVAILDLRHP